MCGLTRAATQSLSPNIHFITLPKNQSSAHSIDINDVVGFFASPFKKTRGPTLFIEFWENDKIVMRPISYQSAAAFSMKTILDAWALNKEKSKFTHEDIYAMTEYGKKLYSKRMYRILLSGIVITILSALLQSVFM